MREMASWMHAGKALQLEAHAGTAGLAAADWGQVFEAAVAALLKYSQARPGDRTMLDALVPAQAAFCAALQEGGCRPCCYETPPPFFLTKLAVIWLHRGFGHIRPVTSIWRSG